MPRAASLWERFLAVVEASMMSTVGYTEQQSGPSDFGESLGAARHPLALLCLCAGSKERVAGGVPVIDVGAA